MFSLVRTPLNQIIGFLELALEGNLEEELRANLLVTHKASKVRHHISPRFPANLTPMS